MLVFAGTNVFCSSAGTVWRGAGTTSEVSPEAGAVSPPGVVETETPGTKTTWLAPQRKRYLFELVVAFPKTLPYSMCTAGDYR